MARLMMFLDHLTRSVCLTVVLIPLVVSGQTEDTTTIQVIRFEDGLDNRRAWRYFPPDTADYRQVLMYQTLKCDATLINNPTGSGCGEWDTGANFYVYDHNHKDSTRYRLGFAYPDSIPTRPTPTFTEMVRKQYHMVYDNTIGEKRNVVGLGEKSLTHVLNTELRSGRAQYLYRADELLASGFSAGTIDKLRLDVSKLGGKLNDFTIRLKNVLLDSVTAEAYVSDGFETVFLQDVEVSAVGQHIFEFTSPFFWDGTSNLVIDMAFSNSDTSAAFEVKGDSMSYPVGIYASKDDQYFSFHDSYVDLNVEELSNQLDSHITISFWTRTNLDLLQAHYTPFYATDSVNVYQLLARLPTTNPRVHWYAGRNGGLDQIRHDESLPNTADFEGWTHWSFTRNGKTSEMICRRNGEVYLEGITGNTDRLIDRIAEFRIGADRASDNRFYQGDINEFRIWNKVLDSASLAQWMYKDVESSHPYFDHLVAYFRFEDTGLINVQDETGKASGTAFGLPAKRWTPGPQQARNLKQSHFRPMVEFIQGVYQSHLDSTEVKRQVENPPISVVVSRNHRDLTKEGMQNVETDTLYTWRANTYTYSIDENGNKLDSTFIPASRTYYNWYTGQIMELAKYITPYGNYLDLGDGFTWVYDVTEFESLLHDTIDLRGGDHRELIDLKFKFIKGTPPRNVNKLQYLKRVRGQYADLVANPHNYINTVYPDQNSTTFGLRCSFSGHGFNNATNCSEFCQREHFIELDNQELYSWIHWKECADNPLYPQGGTWIYDRTGWCPGAPQDILHFDMTQHVTPGQSAQLFKGVKPDPTGTEYGTWGGFIYFISYGDPNFSTDATIYDIISPSNRDEHLRFNPICDNARVVLRNNGSNVLTSARIGYGVEGEEPKTYEWKGNLKFMETEEVVLPMPSRYSLSGQSNRFSARILSANGGEDQYAANDVYHTTFSTPPNLMGDLKLRLRTNGAGEETSWDVRDNYGRVWYSGDSLESCKNKE
ncbi:MAG: hypothetical protein JJ975_10960 [Bacteroidia bacterium]|nr:hypothetical protein [Bacteroidia bacterium]